MKKYLLLFICFFAFCFAPRANAQVISYGTGVFGYTYGNYSPDTNNHRNVTWTGNLPVELLTSVGSVNKTLWGVNYNFNLSNVFSGSYITNSVDTYMGVQQNSIATYLGSNFPVSATCSSHSGENKTVSCTLDTSTSNKRIYKCTCAFTNYDYPSSVSMTIGITNSFLATSPFVSYTGNNTTSSIYVSDISYDAKSSSDPNSGKLDDINNSIQQGTQDIIDNQNQNTQDIIDSQQDTTDAINDLNDTLQETEIDDETIGDKVGEIQQISETPITDLLTMPITLLQKYYTGITGSCSPYNLGSLFNHNLTLPCINGQQLLGSTIWTIIDGLFVIFMVYNIAMMVVSFFESITSLNDTFDSMYQPQHATYHPRHGGDK